MKVVCILENQLLHGNKLILKIIALLYTTKAHDISLCPKGNEVEMILYERNNRTKTFIPLADYIQMSMIIKLACRLNIIDHIPQSTKISFSINTDKYYIRISFHPINNGERCTFRLLRNDVFENSEIVQKILISKGLILIAGKTCSGKTTLLYSCISNFDGNCITLEDPVEYELRNASQTDVSKIGYTDGIKSALRQSPDLICIGEIRDDDSASAAIRATLTGHTVIATVHAISYNHVKIRLEELNAKYLQECVSKIVFCDNFQYKIYDYHDLI